MHPRSDWGVLALGYLPSEMQPGPSWSAGLTDSGVHLFVVESLADGLVAKAKLESFAEGSSCDACNPFHRIEKV